MPRRARSRLYRTILCAALLTLACCAQPATEREPPFSRVVPLPPGTWTTVYTGDQDVLRGEAERQVLFSVGRGVVDRVVLVYRLHLGMRYEFLPRTNCSNEAYWYETTDPQEPPAASGACWHVRAVNLGLAGEPHWVNMAMASYADDRALYLPATMVGVRYVRYHQGDMMQVDYLWNPDLLLPPPEGDVWEPEDWSRDAIDADPRKQAIMQVIRDWAEEWEPRVRDALPL